MIVVKRNGFSYSEKYDVKEKTSGSFEFLKKKKFEEEKKEEENHDNIEKMFGVTFKIGMSKRE